MNKPQITIKDIARALNVSPSTVSRALKDNPDISKETRDLIHAYAREHNYKPNVLAVNLRASRSNTIGVIIPQLVHHFFSCVTNVFTITNYKGIDPEVFGGIDNNLYPRPFTAQLGLTLNF